MVMLFTMILGGNMADYIFCVVIAVALYLHLVSDSVVVV